MAAELLAAATQRQLDQLDENPAFGSAKTWPQDSHLDNYVCHARHTRLNSPACAAFRAGPVE
jgi:hypothetical protein